MDHCIAVYTVYMSQRFEYIDFGDVHLDHADCNAMPRRSLDQRSVACAIVREATRNEENECNKPPISVTACFSPGGEMPRRNYIGRNVNEIAALFRPRYDHL